MTSQTDGPWRPVDTLAARLVLIRRQLGLSQRAASEATGIGFGSWQSMEDGRSPHNLIEKVQRICDAFGVDRDWLMWGGPLAPSGPTTVDLRKPTATEGSEATTSGSSGRSRQLEQPIERRRDWARRARWDRDHIRRVIPAQRHAFAAA